MFNKLFNVSHTRSLVFLIQRKCELIFEPSRGFCQNVDINKFTYRTHTCGQLRAEDVDKHVSVCGWLQFQRMNQFAILRDAYGITQIVLDEEKKDFIDLLSKTPLESVIHVKGKVKKRPSDQVNQKIPTGEIEVIAQEFKVLNKCHNQLPFTIREYKKANESLRMKYRYLDLRFPDMQRNLRLRSDLLMKMRNFLAEKGFLEVETPTLFKRTPGGAQEFIVPTQNEGKFYSLVQSPQQLKQLLMVGGIDRYFQFARCYRDETSRPDRQPEFTQLDIELSFTDYESVIELVEKLIEHTISKYFNFRVPFQRITYEESMEQYGTDQPDLTILPKIETLDISLPNGHVAKYLKIPETSSLLKNSTKDNFFKLQRTLSPNVMLSVLKHPGSNWDNFAEKLKGWDHSKQDLKEAMHVNEGDTVFLSIGPKSQVLKILGKLRTVFVNMLRESGISGRWEDQGADRFVWVVDFPLFEMDDGKIKSAHHPFTSPHPEDVHLLETNPLQVRGLHYDLVMNGWEIGGGSVRIHDSALQKSILKEILNIPTKDLEHLLQSLGSGAPPHAGVALGIDRLVSIIVGAKSIRDVIAFPKSSDAKDLMTDAPSPVSQDELELYHIDVKKCEKQTNEMNATK